MDNAEHQSLRAKLATIGRHLPGGGLLFAVALLAVLGYFGWYYYGAAHLDHALYSLQLEKLSVTPQPDWIKSNVAEDVFRTGRLDRVSLLQPHANATIARAFETNHWVQAASRVTKSAGGKVVVDLVYRRPAAMVYYQKQASEPVAPNEPQHFFFPIDQSGVVLPTQDFSSEDVWRYFMVFAEDAQLGSIGIPYGDSRVLEALTLCRMLEPYREPHRLQEIWVTHDGIASGESPWVFTLATRDKREVVWGHAPGVESRGEPPADAKLERLVEWLAEDSHVADSSQPPRLELWASPTNQPVSSRNR